VYPHVLLSPRSRSAPRHPPCCPPLSSSFIRPLCALLLFLVAAEGGTEHADPGDGLGRAAATALAPPENLAATSEPASAEATCLLIRPRRSRVSRWSRASRALDVSGSSRVRGAARHETTAPSDSLAGVMSGPGGPDAKIADPHPHSFDAAALLDACRTWCCDRHLLTDRAGNDTCRRARVGRGPISAGRRRLRSSRRRRRRATSMIRCRQERRQPRRVRGHPPRADCAWHLVELCRTDRSDVCPVSRIRVRAST